MQKKLKATRRGQTTIPAEIRGKMGLREGDKLVEEVTNQGILFKLILKLEDCAGIYLKYKKVEAIKREIVLDNRFFIEHYYSNNAETKQKTNRKIREHI